MTGRFDPEESSSYTCPKCGRTSHNPEDALHRYCGHCHIFEEFDELSSELVPAFDKFSDKFKQRFARLEDRKIVACSLTEWATWDPECVKRIIGRHETETHLVSTVFLGLDHAFYSDVRPRWFETMIFDKTQRYELELDGKLTGEWTNGDVIYEERYSTLEEAEQGHQAAIAWLREELAKK
jgi:hypothetical protein